MPERVERVPRGALRKRMKMPQNKLFKHSMHTFFIRTNICYMIDKMWFWRALYDFPFTYILRDAKMKKKKVIFKRTTAWCLAYLFFQKLALVCFQIRDIAEATALDGDQLLFFSQEINKLKGTGGGEPARSLQ